MNKSKDTKRTRELLELHSEAVSAASKFLKDIITDSAFMEFFDITRKVVRAKGGVYISSIGEKSKRNAAIANLLATNVDQRRASYSNFPKTDSTLEDIYQKAMEGVFEDKNLLIVGDPKCKYGTMTIKRFIRRGVNQLRKKAEQKGTKAPFPRNIIYLKYATKGKKTYLEKISLYPFDGIPHPVFRKKPSYG